MPKISVIVPVYKVEAYLSRCVDSILSQTFADFELWLVDDGSPDRCGELCDEYAQKDARVRVIHKQNGGLSDARNAALDVMTGEYVSFIDADDWVAPDFLESLLTAIERHHCPMAICNFVAVYDDGVQESMYRAATEETVLEGEHIFDTLPQPSACNKMYEAALFRTVRYPVGRLYEDVFVYHDILEQLQKLVCTGKDSYFYFTRHDSIMHSAYTYRAVDIVDAVYARANKLEELGQPRLANEARLVVYSQTAVAYARLDRKDEQNRARLAEATAIYRECYPKLMADPLISKKQKLRLWLLRRLPSLHTQVFGKRMPQN
ncbi:MAG: glycosyltransferase family 2 protein [Acutalibacteraceae bacterium]